MSSSATILPRQSGCEISTITRTRIKPPHSSVFAFGSVKICPASSHSVSATVIVINFTGKPCNWIQNGVLLKSKSSILLTPSYFYKIIKCLSKLHGVFARIVSTFVSLSKVKSMIWFPRFLILKPRLDLHIGIKVAATASGLSALLVRNLATRMEIGAAISSCSRTLGPSL